MTISDQFETVRIACALGKLNYVLGAELKMYPEVIFTFTLSSSTFLMIIEFVFFKEIPYKSTIIDQYYGPTVFMFITTAH